MHFVFAVVDFQRARAQCCYQERDFELLIVQEQSLCFEEFGEKENQVKLLGCERGYWKID